jgi:hypothetical protein
MHTRARLRLNESTAVAPVAEEDPDLPVDAEDTDDDLEHLPQEKRIQLAVAATQAKLMSERKAAIYFGVSRTTVNRRANGILSRTEGHIHERRLSPAQEDILAEWIKVRIWL